MMSLRHYHSLFSEIRRRNITRKDRVSQTVFERPALSRRQFITSTAAVSVALGLGLRGTAEAKKFPPSTGVIDDCSAAPVPIPGGFNAFDLLGSRFPDRFFHLFLPGAGVEPSTIFNFKGDVAILDIRGHGTRTELDPFTGEPTNVMPDLPFAADVRFMDGDYIGADGKKHKGTFGFY
jgi:hypothetical protein